MIKMKNILAENMLRFGVKNLNESDVEKLHQTSLTEDDVASKNQIAAPNYWIDKMEVLGGGSTKQYNFTNFEKDKVTDRTTGMVGNVTGRESNVGQFTVPNSIKGYDNIKAYLETGKGGGNGYFDFDVNKTDQTMVNIPARITGAKTTPKAAIAAYNAMKSWRTGKDRYGKPYSYGVNAEGVTTVWELIVKMITASHG